MGLPSGVQWASCNVGAEKPNDPGLYFSWGNVEGHEIGEGYDFSPEVYAETPAAAISTDLSLDQDAARAYLGTPWRLPSASDFVELYNNCTVVWTKLNGVNGRLFTSNINGATLFFPAAGYYNGTALSSRGSTGLYISSTYYSAASARVMSLNASQVNPQNDRPRRYGMSVRAVVQSP